MLGLISLLLDSPLLLFFILAAVFSFIQSRSKSRNEEGTEASRAPQQQTYEQGEEASGERRDGKDFDWKEILFEGEKEVKNEKKQEKANSQTEMQKHYEKVEQKRRRADKSAAKVERSPIVQGDLTQAENSNANIDFSTMSKQDVVKGIVWAEVLGKPKSKQRR